MICKVNQGMSFSGLIEYITNELKDGHIIASNGVSTVSNRAIRDSFEIQSAMGASRTRYPVGHFALSWHKNERSRMNDEFMAQLAKEFLQELGYADTQYVVTVHNDTDHPHCHIAYNRIANNGKTLSNSLIKLRAIKACRTLEERHNLRPVTISKLDTVDDAKLRGKDKAEFALKKTVLNTARQCRTWSQFESELANAGVKMSFRFGQDDGIKGVIFSDGEHSFGGKSLHADLSLTSLDKRFGNELKKCNFGIALPSSAIVPVVIPGTAPAKDSHGAFIKPEPKAQVKEMPGITKSDSAYKQEPALSSLSSDAMKAADYIAEDIIITAKNAIAFIAEPLLFVDPSTISMGGGGQSNNDLDRKKKDEDELPRVQQPQQQPNTGYRRRGRR